MIQGFEEEERRIKTVSVFSLCSSRTTTSKREKKKKKRRGKKKRKKRKSAMGDHERRTKPFEHLLIS